jgi:hypothetical protein
MKFLKLNIMIINIIKRWIKRFFCKHEDDMFEITKKGKLGVICCIGYKYVCKKCGRTWKCI